MPSRPKGNAHDAFGVRLIVGLKAGCQHGARPKPSYHMNTLTQLEQRLQREVPLLAWHCQSCEAMQTVSSSGIPDEIEITF